MIGLAPDAAGLDARRGFTLMELIIVLTILGIMSAAVVPVFRGTLATVQADHAVRDLVATIKYAQERAVADTKEYRLYLDPKNNQYWLMRLSGINEKNKKQFEPLDERFGEPMDLPDRFPLDKVTARKDKDNKQSYIAFYPNGACSKATITLRKEGGKPVKIETEGSLGQIKVTDK
jgi:type II secretion system protein H